jgi:hypothetical protein
MASSGVVPAQAGIQFDISGWINREITHPYFPG